MGTLIAVYDACVLHSDPLRDFMMELSLSDAVRAHWSEKIHEEWIRSVERTKPELKGKMQRVRELMDEANPDALVTGFEEIIEKLDLPDPNDRHVLAAAIKIKAEFIVTKNLRDFPRDKLEPFGVKAVHPDDFALYVSLCNPEVIIRTAKQCRARRKRRPNSPEEYLEVLERNEMTAVAAELRKAIDLI